jgi:tetratricopeptide (TPR) repeat protein
LSGNAILGTICDQSRRPIPDVWVELLDDVNSILARTRTDAAGRYSFYRLASAIFQVRVLTDGLHTGETRRVELVSSGLAGGTGSHQETVDFYLKARSDAAGAPTTSKAGVLFVQDVPQPAREAYEQGLQLLRENPEAGVSKLKEAIEIFPDYYAALERVGVECVRLRQYEPALAALDKAVRINPEGHGSFYALGVAQYQLKRMPEAIATLNRMLALAPDSPNAPFAKYCLGVALLRTGKPSEAEPRLKSAAESGGKNVPADVHMALAQIFSNSNRHKEAADELELFLQEAPDARDAEKIKQLIGQLRAKAR